MYDNHDYDAKGPIWSDNLIKILLVKGKKGEKPKQHHQESQLAWGKSRESWSNVLKSKSNLISSHGKPPEKDVLLEPGWALGAGCRRTLGPTNPGGPASRSGRRGRAQPPSPLLPCLEPAHLGRAGGRGRANRQDWFRSGRSSCDTRHTQCFCQNQFI